MFIVGIKYYTSPLVGLIAAKEAKKQAKKALAKAGILPLSYPIAPIVSVKQCGNCGASWSGGSKCDYCDRAYHRGH